MSARDDNPSGPNAEVAQAIRVAVHGHVQGVGFRYAAMGRARSLGLAGWVRNGEHGELLAHVEGAPQALEQLVDFLREGPRLADVSAVETRSIAVEGHEQFAIRGVSAGVTIVADGAPATAERLKRVLDGDPGIGILRHADAGYDIAIEQAERTGLSATVPQGLST